MRRGASVASTVSAMAGDVEIAAVVEGDVDVDAESDAGLHAVQSVKSEIVSSERRTRDMSRFKSSGLTGTHSRRAYRLHHLCANFDGQSRPGSTTSIPRAASP